MKRTIAVAPVLPLWQARAGRRLRLVVVSPEHLFARLHGLIVGVYHDAAVALSVRGDSLDRDPKVEESSETAINTPRDGFYVKLRTDH